MFAFEKYIYIAVVKEKDGKHFKYLFSDFDGLREFIELNPMMVKAIDSFIYDENSDQYHYYQPPNVTVKYTDMVKDGKILNKTFEELLIAESNAIYEYFQFELV